MPKFNKNKIFIKTIIHIHAHTYTHILKYTINEYRLKSDPSNTNIRRRMFLLVLTGTIVRLYYIKFNNIVNIFKYLSSPNFKPNILLDTNNNDLTACVVLDNSTKK